MKKQVTKTKKQQRSNKSSRFLAIFVLFGGLLLTVAAMLSPHYLKQFAQYSAPPIFGCLHTGEADPTNCGTKMGTSGQLSLSLNGRPFDSKNQEVYYGDTLSGSYEYSNTGDQPIAIKSMGIAGGALNQYYIADFAPFQGPATLQPKQSVAIKTAYHQFNDSDPNGEWVIGAGVTDTNGQNLPIDTNTHIKVNATCTALRVKPLTDQDKSDIKSLCTNTPGSPLCTSKEYCQIFKGGSCPQPDVSPNISGQQCDDSIVLDQNEQDLLEEVCTTYPDADACQGFCDRSIGSSICPDDASDVTSSRNFVGPRAVAGATTGPGIVADTATIDEGFGRGATAPQPVIANPAQATSNTSGSSGSSVSSNSSSSSSSSKKNHKKSKKNKKCKNTKSSKKKGSKCCAGKTMSQSNGKCGKKNTKSGSTSGGGSSGGSSTSGNGCSQTGNGSSNGIQMCGNTTGGIVSGVGGNSANNIPGSGGISGGTGTSFPFVPPNGYTSLFGGGTTSSPNAKP